ncbi:zinc finger protein [Holotrichia oblita]|uniref:Zinc finger protein n=1 Tax=Holotrichia oblita TaxID=644536 RepID=A0ACB9T4P9_HOLOL|nr:zinc finger protein [Holotrichia oblita]
MPRSLFRKNFTSTLKRRLIKFAEPDIFNNNITAVNINSTIIEDTCHDKEPPVEPPTETQEHLLEIEGSSRLENNKKMMEDFDEDTHYCIKCHATIIGLDNYVSHRKSKCGQNLDHPELPKSPLPSQLLPPDESFSLKADDFFSSLELQSSSKKITSHSTTGKTFNRILTRSKASAVIQATNAAKESITQSKSGKNAWIGGHQLKELGGGDNQAKLIKAVDNLSRSAAATLKKDDAHNSLRTYDESEEDSDDYYYDDEKTESEDDAPPRSHTGGKWKPSGSPIQWNNEGNTWNAPPMNYTGGKWKPKRNSPPPTHTKGKWKPASPNAHAKESFDIPRPTYTGGKWSASKALNKIEYLEPEQRDDSFEHPKPSFTGGKWAPSKVALNNEQRSDYFNIPKPSYTGGKWVASKTVSRSDYDKAKDKGLQNENWNSEEYDHPPPTHTKGKWKPSQEESKTSPPSTYTKGKWLPKQDNKEDSTKNVYSITPADGSPFRKSNGKVQYWCGPCNRHLASKTIYERHLKSDLHLRRTQRDPEFDDTTSSDLNTNQPKENNKESVEYWSHAAQDNEDSMKKSAGSGTRRIRKRIYVKCEVCRSRLHNQLMGKHLISHYHCRKGDITLPEARRMVLDNIYSIVLQSPYQCAPCSFYCNTQDDFLRHWCSVEHHDQVSKSRGTFVCVFCKLETDDNNEMFKHLVSEEHNEVISVINRSVPIIIKCIRRIECQTCKQTFLLNIQLRKHCEKEGHPYSSTCTDIYQSKHTCEVCKEIFRSKVAYQRHKRKSHKKHIYICSTCDISFETRVEAKLHRRTREHRCAVQVKKSKTNAAIVLERKCQYCAEILENIIALHGHLKEKHPEHSHSCPHCGKSFTIPQQLAVHLRSKACTFQHTEIYTNRCDKCPFSTESMSELLFHKVLHSEPLLVYSDDGSKDKKHPTQKYKCPMCHKFFSKLSLRCHIRLHTKERPYTCLNCNSSFIRKNNWISHTRRCGKGKTNEDKNKKKGNPDSNLSDRPYLCSTCGASFKKK